MATTANRAPIPVILDTDIGDDIDDTWALAMLLKSPELDVRLITTCFGDTRYRAELVAKLLEVAGRTDIPIGIGPQQHAKRGPQAAWLDGYDLKRYPGRIHDDGVGAMVSTILAAPRPVTLIGIGPATNIGAAVVRDPEIGRRARLVGMFGNIRKPFGTATAAVPEYNVKVDVPAARAMFAAPWKMTITPLDTCGAVVLKGAAYATVRDSADPLTAAVIANYRCWAAALKRSAEEQSSVLFDTVAIYLAFADDLLRMEKLPLRVDDDGLTAVVAPGQGRLVNCATDWKDLAWFEEFLVRRLIDEPVVPATSG